MSVCTGEWLVVELWLSGRVALITGASRGIGAATAAAVAAAGAHVVLAARDRSALEGVAGRIRDARGRATAVPTDVSDAAAVPPLFGAVSQAGSLSALVCAAGVLTPALFADTTLALWRETLEGNLTGTFLCCRARCGRAGGGGGGGGPPTPPRCRGCPPPRSPGGGPRTTCPSTGSSA